SGRQWKLPGVEKDTTLPCLDLAKPLYQALHQRISSLINRFRLTRPWTRDVEHGDGAANDPILRLQTVSRAEANNEKWFIQTFCAFSREQCATADSAF